MALKSDRSTLQTDISFFMNEAATRGGVVCQRWRLGRINGQRCRFGYVYSFSIWTASSGTVC